MPQRSEWWCNVTGAINEAGPHSVNRLFEWVLAGILGLLGMTLLLPGTSLASVGLATLFGMTVSDEGVGIVLVGLGLIRGYALWRNGDWFPVSARVRAGCAFLSALFFVQMTVALIAVGVVSGTPHIMVAITGMIVAGEVATSFRAVLDAGPCA